MLINLCLGGFIVYVGLMKSSVQDMPLGLLTSLTCTELDQVLLSFIDFANLFMDLNKFSCPSWVID